MCFLKRHDRLIVPFQSMITGLSVNSEEEQSLDTLAEAPGADFEAATFVGNALHVASKSGSDATMATR